MEAMPVLIKKLNEMVSQLPSQRVQEVIDFTGYLLKKESDNSGLSPEQQRALELVGIINGPHDLAEKHDDYVVKFTAPADNP
jgi:hypothetical protein